ncbi:MAG TPA: CRISPR-associated protein, partial [Deltaproteobacteria bacterium]|nr:CRISPR-associated protein [Deltaproteobacteria bacterium]
MRDTLICTVGTSLMGNVARADDAELVRLLDDRNAKGLAVRLGSFEPDEHLLGAEINSIHSIVSQGLITER